MTWRELPGSFPRISCDGRAEALEGRIASGPLCLPPAGKVSPALTGWDWRSVGFRKMRVPAPAHRKHADGPGQCFSLCEPQLSYLCMRTVRLTPRVAEERCLCFRVWCFLEPRFTDEETEAGCCVLRGFVEGLTAA